jgi:hypothetical protein
MSGGPPTLGVVILALRGGARLAEAIDAVAWSDVRAVLALDGQQLPADLRPDVVVLGTLRDLPRLAVDRVLVLRESERVDGDGVAALRAAVAIAGPDDVGVLPIETALLDLAIVAEGGLARLARPDVPIVLRAGFAIEFARTGRTCRSVDAPVHHARGETLDQAVELAGIEGDTLASLMEATKVRSAGILWHPFVAASRVLLGRAPQGQPGLGRWLVAAIEGYAVVVAYAKRWERRRDRAAAWVEVAR